LGRSGGNWKLMLNRGEKRGKRPRDFSRGAVGGPVRMYRPPTLGGGKKSKSHEEGTLKKDFESRWGGQEGSQAAERTPEGSE